MTGTKGFRKMLASVRWEGGHVWIRHCKALEKKKYRDMQAPLTPESQKRKLPLVLQLDGNPYARNAADKEALRVLFDIADNRRGAFFNILRRPEWAWLKDWAYGRVSEKLTCNGRFEPNMGTVALWLFSGYVDFPECPYCSGPISPDGNVGLRGYGSHCSNRCKTLDPAVQDKIRATVRKDDPDASWTSSTKKAKRHYRQTCQKKYGRGITNAFQAEECKQKIKATTKDRHGDENYRNDEQRIKTNRAKFNGKGSNGDAISETYMCDFTEEQWDDKNEKIKATKARNHGDPNFNNRQKAKQTCRKTYGCDSQLQAPEIREKIKATNRKHCGYDCNFQSDATKELSQYTLDKLYGPKRESITEKAKSRKFEKYGTECSPSWRYKYDGKSFDSGWELAYYIWLTDCGVDFSYPSGLKIKYIDTLGNSHSYCPDFLVEGVITEIKGDQFFDAAGNLITPYGRKTMSAEEVMRLDTRDAAKFECMKSHGVKVLRKSDAQRFLDYVSEKYGKDYLASFRAAQ